MMVTIFEAFSRGRNFKTGQGDYGLEVETETLDQDAYPREFFGVPTVENVHGYPKNTWYPKSIPEWKVTEDGSLRNFGREFVFKQPLKAPLALAAIDSFGKATAGVKFLHDAPATSVHVHINVTDKSLLQFANLLTLLVFFENILTEYSGPVRRSPVYARPTRCADMNFGTIKNVLSYMDQGSTQAIAVSEGHSKYAVINLATVGSYGSVEIRCMRGVTNPEILKEWILILDCINRYSMLSGLTPLNFYKKYQEDPEGILSEVFGDMRDAVSVKDWKYLLRRQEFLLAELSICVKNWYELGDKYKVKTKTVEKRGLSDQPVTTPWPTVTLAQLVEQVQAHEQQDPVIITNEILPYEPDADPEYEGTEF